MSQLFLGIGTDIRKNADRCTVAEKDNTGSDKRRKKQLFVGENW